MESYSLTAARFVSTVSGEAHAQLKISLKKDKALRALEKEFMHEILV